jgi:acid phosphatase (class A)
MQIRFLIFSLSLLSLVPELYAQEINLAAKLPDGYIKKEALPNSVIIVPKAPAPSSPRQKLDDAISQAALKLSKTARFSLATKDASMRFPDAPNSFACAMGKLISKEKTPHLYHLLIRAGVDAGFTTYKAKYTYNRLRPFTINNASTCTPQQEEKLRHNGSYPSGHASRGWVWALIFSELLPQRADAILARGRAYGESRIICNVHWYSDIVAGKLMGASAFAMMHANPEFIVDMKAAKAELFAAPAPDEKMCRKEAAELLIGFD